MFNLNSHPRCSGGQIFDTPFNYMPSASNPRAPGPITLTPDGGGM